MRNSFILIAKKCLNYVSFLFAYKKAILIELSCQIIVRNIIKKFREIKFCNKNARVFFKFKGYILNCEMYISIISIGI